MEALNFWSLFIFRPSHHLLHSLLPVCFPHVDVIALPQFLCLYPAKGAALTAGEKGKPICSPKPKTALRGQRELSHGHLLWPDDSKAFADSPVEFLPRFHLPCRFLAGEEHSHDVTSYVGQDAAFLFSMARPRPGGSPSEGILPFLNEAVINQLRPWLGMCMAHTGMRIQQRRLLGLH